MKFTWDSNKARTNLKKHGVGFEEAATIFNHPGTVIQFDFDHSSRLEERWIAQGISKNLNLLIVVYCERDHDVFRIIHARKK